MLHPSKKAAAIAVVERQRQAAFHTRDLRAFTAAEKRIKELESMPDELTCIHCGEDFPADTPHVEFLIAALVVFDLVLPKAVTEDGEEIAPPKDAKPELVATERYDFGINNVASGSGLGRRIKICGKCIKGARWKIHPRDYIEMR